MKGAGNDPMPADDKDDIVDADSSRPLDETCWAAINLFEALVI